MAKDRSSFLIRIALPLAMFALPIACRAQEKIESKPEKTSICDVLKDPGAFNHKLIEVTGFVTRGFEDSILFDPGCDSRFRIWVDVGGKGGTGVMYCCGFTPKKLRPEDLVVEGITVPLMVDEPYANFDKALGPRPYGAMVRARLVGRFFSGEKTKYPNGKEGWTGFGHMGMASLFAIQQVLSVDVRDQPGLDHSSSVEQPNRKREGCDNTYRFLYDEVFSELIDQQNKAEGGERGWALDDPQRVAAEELAKHTKAFTGKVSELKEVSRTDGRIIYHWRSSARNGGMFMIVVNRPYWLSFYAKDPAKTAWVVAAAYSVC
ncbi:MAG: hypothetical protein ABIP75_10735 [Pyrinomonadaceae bacterium]